MLEAETKFALVCRTNVLYFVRLVPKLATERQPTAGREGGLASRRFLGLASSLRRAGS
jgi:hypothetical protein